MGVQSLFLLNLKVVEPISAALDGWEGGLLREVVGDWTVWWLKGRRGSGYCPVCGFGRGLASKMPKNLLKPVFQKSEPASAQTAEL